MEQCRFAIGKRWSGTSWICGRE